MSMLCPVVPPFQLPFSGPTSSLNAMSSDRRTLLGVKNRSHEHQPVPSVHSRYSIALFLPTFDAAAIVQARPEVLAGEVVQTEPDEAPLRPRQETTPLTVRLAVVGLPPVADAQVPIHQRHSEFPAVGVPVPVAA